MPDVYTFMQQARYAWADLAQTSDDERQVRIDDREIDRNADLDEDVPQ